MKSFNAKKGFFAQQMWVLGVSLLRSNVTTKCNACGVISPQFGKMSVTQNSK